MSKLVSDRHSRLIIYFWIIFNQSENLWQESYYFHSDQLQKQQQQASCTCYEKQRHHKIMLCSIIKKVPYMIKSIMMVHHSVTR
ncbi:unnamed protein product [Rotaria socialis]